MNRLKQGSMNYHILQRASAVVQKTAEQVYQYIYIYIYV